MERMEKEVLYHGTSLSGISGSQIDLSRENKGVGGNSLTLGKGFYMTDQLYVAQLFSHIAEKKRLLCKPGIDPLEQISQSDKAGLGRLYTIELKEARILEGDAVVNSQVANHLLTAAGISLTVIDGFIKKDAVALNDIANVLRSSKVIKDNVWEYITRSLAYDGLRICEDRWNNWDYYPSDLGIDYKQFKKLPVTLILYDTAKISSFRELYFNKELLVKLNQPQHNLKINIPNRNSKLMTKRSRMG